MAFAVSEPLAFITSDNVPITDANHSKLPPEVLIMLPAVSIPAITSCIATDSSLAKLYDTATITSPKYSVASAASIVPSSNSLYC